MTSPGGARFRLAVFRCACRFLYACFALRDASFVANVTADICGTQAVLCHQLADSGNRLLRLLLRESFCLNLQLAQTGFNDFELWHQSFLLICWME